MDWNLDSETGMNNATEWLANHLNLIKQGGVWGIPRAASAYVIDHKHKELRLSFGAGDKPTERVAEKIGWSVK